MKEDLTPITGERPSEAARRSQMMPDFRAAVAAYGMPLSWVLAFAAHETAFRNIRSAPGQRDDVLGGSFGPMQVSSVVAKELGCMPFTSHAARGEWILNDAARGIDLGTRYLLKLARRVGGDLARVAAAYNAGPGAVLGNKIPRTTRERYVPAILALQKRYASLDAVAETDAIG